MGRKYLTTECIDFSRSLVPDIFLSYNAEERVGLVHSSLEFDVKGALSFCHLSFFHREDSSRTVLPLN